MVDQKILNYIRKQMQAGYDIDVIRNHLIHYGYDQEKVDEAVRIVRHPHLGMVIVAVALVVVIGGVFFLIFGNKGAEQLLDVKTSTLIHEIEAGNILTFTTEMTNMGAKQRYDLLISHELLDAGENMINSKQESVAIETTASKSSQIMIPGNAAAGIYTLKTTVYYNNKEAVASFSFIVKKKGASEVPITTKECPLSCEDNNDCTEDKCSAATNFECEHKLTAPCCGNNICESGESYITCSADCEKPAVAEQPKELTLAGVQDQVRELAARSPVQADNFCRSLEQENFNDLCYRELASITLSSSYCDKIISDTKRDQCYTEFALKGDYLVCDKMTNKYLKQSCISLRNLPPR